MSKVIPKSDPVVKLGKPRASITFDVTQGPLVIPHEVSRELKKQGHVTYWAIDDVQHVASARNRGYEPVIFRGETYRCAECVLMSRPQKIADLESAAQAKRVADLDSHTYEKTKAAIRAATHGTADVRGGFGKANEREVLDF